jgi:hypothetical protein
MRSRPRVTSGADNVVCLTRTAGEAGPPDIHVLATTGEVSISVSAVAERRSMCGCGGRRRERLEMIE